VETLKYTVIAQTKAAGCKDTAAITVYVNEDPYTLMPNAFTPNGDGLNDYIFPRSNKSFTIQKFVIFNRWGNEVYDYATGDKNGWDGNYKGVPAAQAVYAYYIAVNFSNGKFFQRKGNITLLRSHP
jgi:gliding motility-associated-like protein